MSDENSHTSASNDRVYKRNGAHNAARAVPSANPRSCVTCRRRKVKCDKSQPCSNCTRAKIECIFPGPGRAPRRSRKPPDGELMDRLRRLEGVVQTLNAQVEEHEQEAASRDTDKEKEKVNDKEPSPPDSSDGCPYGGESSPSVAKDNSVDGLENRFGRLVVDQGRSRYINNSFWASLNNEVEDLKAILIEPSDDEDDQDSPESNQALQQGGFIFGYSSSNVDMLSLHPNPERALEFWKLYQENVDPLVKVLHVPSFELKFRDAIENTHRVPKGLEPLMFVVYYGAVTSVTQSECWERWGEDRTSLLTKYRFALEQALARANFLFCDEIIILQAFVVFLNLLRRNDEPRKIWTLTGLAVRLAQSLGIHRDGSHFDLLPFEIESRRRLWWQVCLLDARAAEDHGCDPTIVEAQFDTRMPLNINDTDLEPDMKEMPKERQGFTDMTFCVIRFELTNIFRRIIYIPPGPNRCNQFFANLTISEKEQWIGNCHQRLEEKYLKHCHNNSPLCWVTATVSRLVMSKMWLIVYHPHQRHDGGASLPQETKDKLFITSLENVEYSLLLETEARTMKWGWLFRTYVQWHAIAFLLSELCIRTKGEAVERAWRAIGATTGRWWFPHFKKQQSKTGCLWKPLRKLMDKARAARERELALERASQALKNGATNGGLMYPQFARAVEQMPAQAPSDQPSPETLDKMLRPSAPRLGEIPSATSPSSKGSPPAQDLPSPFGNSIQFNATTPNGGLDGTSPNRPSVTQGQDFTDLSAYGMDAVIRDVMDGMATDGTYENDSLDFSTDLLQAPLQDPVTQTPSTTTLSGTMDFSQDAAPFANPGLADTPPTESPIIDAANMDWAGWDDLVSQYGVDGSGQTVGGGLGMVHWF
ncbi:hypothetical protein BDV95DRAFT_562751 [Massariosphaeria phaeospora]|uniref:Zn(2)-C6 fungal-type domain-containing protein n=1 Tax=Massariosphaeria phaeospora TaxID=100035 RepID=A0A7C8ILV3_9PLEO|nr:hypothetical protein BDV95DRAFT_562751 [Massariosphaeria phaeospora]